MTKSDLFAVFVGAVLVYIADQLRLLRIYAQNQQTRDILRGGKGPADH